MPAIWIVAVAWGGIMVIGRFVGGMVMRDEDRNAWRELHPDTPLPDWLERHHARNHADR